MLYKFDGFRKIGFLDYSKDIWANRHAVQVKMNGIGKCKNQYSHIEQYAIKGGKKAGNENGKHENEGE